MSLTEVCRLCQRQDNLMWVFDERFENNNMKNIVYVTTGVEINQNDMISQKICQICGQVTLKMFDFRKKAIATDKCLKDRLEELLRSKEMKKESSEDEQNKTVHSSILEILELNPGIKLPETCLTNNITPFVSLALDNVEQYFFKRKLDMKIEERLALKSSRNFECQTFSNYANLVIPNDISITPILCKSNKTTDLQKNRNVVKKKTWKIKLKTKPSARVSENLKKHSESLENGLKDLDATCQINVLTEEQPVSSFENEVNTLEKGYSVEMEETANRDIIKKPAFIQSLGLTPINSVTEAVTLKNAFSPYVNKSVPLHMCRICNSVQYSAQNLKKHLSVHLNCQFCKVKFRSFEKKSRHLENFCPIKNMMNNPPKVVLCPIEKDFNTRLLYSNVFEKFFSGSQNEKFNINSQIKSNSPNLSFGKSNTFSSNQLDNNINADDKTSNIPLVTDKLATNITYSFSNDIPSISEKQNKEIPNKLQENNEISKNFIEIIEILSDEEVAREPLIQKNAQSSSKDISVASIKTNISSPRNPELTANVPQELIKQSINISTILKSPIANIISDLTCLPSASLTTIKPIIGIKNSTLLDKIGTDMSDTNKTIKNLFDKCRSFKMFCEKSAQTEVPCSNDIQVNNTDVTIEFKDLTQFLYVYKIPVEVRHGELSAIYKYVPKQNLYKNINLWNDLTPIDVVPKVVDPQENETSTNKEFISFGHQVSDKETTFSSSISQRSSQDESFQHSTSLNTDFQVIQSISPVTDINTENSGIFPTLESILSSNTNEYNKTKMESLQKKNSSDKTALSRNCISSQLLATDSSNTRSLIPCPGMIRIKNIMELT